MSNYERVTSDILIIGGGGSAALAALAAMNLGAEVVLVSKESSFVGGATKQASGGICIVYEASDSPEIFYKDIIEGGAKINNPRLAKIMAERSHAALLSLEQYGFLLDRSGPSLFRRVLRSEGHTWARGYLDRRENLGLCNGLSNALARSSIKFYPEVMVVKLLVNQGQAVGALGFSLLTGEYLTFNAKAVLLATGGLGQLYEVTTNAKTLTGDGYAMAWDIGASLVDMEMVQFLPLNFPYPKARRGVIIGMCSILGPNVKLYNGLGERYMHKYDPERCEYSTRDIVSRGNYTEIIEGRGTERGTIIVDTTEQDSTLLGEYRSSLPIVYGRIADIFGEDAANWKKPFEAIPAQHFFMGGVMINDNFRTNVPGLFAVGEVSGGTQGANRLSGTALTEVIVMGNLAGESMTQWIKDRKLIPPNMVEIYGEIARLESMFHAKPEDGLRPFQIKERIKSVMWSYLGPVRDKDGMEKAITALKDIQSNDLPRLSLQYRDLKYNRERVEAVEAGFMVKTALMIAQSALAREESRGSHYRSDFPVTNDKEWLKNTLVDKGKDGDVAISYQSMFKRQL
jgi:fumarate reductase (CoM/CoB) subunit A